MAAPNAFFEIIKMADLATEVILLKKQESLTHEAIEYDIDRIAIEVAGKNCRKGQLITLDGIIHMEQEQHNFVITGKIVDVRSIGISRSTVILELRNYNKVLWKKFFLLLKQKKKTVETLFLSMREDE